MLRILFILSVLPTSVFAGSSWSQLKLSDSQQDSVNTFVEDYLQAHPEYTAKQCRFHKTQEFIGTACTYQAPQEFLQNSEDTISLLTKSELYEGESVPHIVIETFQWVCSNEQPATIAPVSTVSVSNAAHSSQPKVKHKKVKVPRYKPNYKMRGSTKCPW